MAMVTPLATSAVEQLRGDVIRELGTAAIDPNFDIDGPCCARYLRARQGDAAEAKKMLLATVAWRREFKVAKLVEQRFDVIQSEAATGKVVILPATMRDKDGRVIMVMRSRLENTHDHDGNIAHLVYQLERAVMETKRATAAAAKESGETETPATATALEKWSLIVDFNGYSMMNAPPMKTSRATLSLLQDHYPERLHRAFIVDAPWLFSQAYRLLSPFIDLVTRDKIRFVSSGKELAEHFPLESLESCLGGHSDYTYDKESYLREDRACFDAARDTHAEDATKLGA